MAMGFSMAFPKAVFAGIGETVTWTSARFSFSSDAITVQVKEQIVDDVARHLDKMMKGNVISEDDLVSWLGKANCVAGLMYVWKPFLSMAWAAIYNTAARGNAPPRCVWTSQVAIPLNWCKLFLRNEADEMRRIYTIEAYMNLGTRVVITVDASPWAIGGFLILDGEICEFFSTSSCGMKILKCLALNMDLISPSRPSRRSR